MSDKRRSIRTDLESKLILQRVDKVTEGKEVTIEVENLSKTGMGFISDKPLEIGAVYEGYLRIWTQEVIHAFIEVVRIEKKGDTYHCGGLFIGMPEMEACRISVYQTVLSEEAE